MNFKYKFLHIIARRAVACPHWQWAPGMLDDLGRRVLGVENGYPTAWSSESFEGLWSVDQPDDPDRAFIWRAASIQAPDLTDDATLGCLLTLVRQVWAPALVSVHPHRSEPYWEVKIDAPAPLRDHVFCAAAEAEALVAALEAVGSYGPHQNEG